MGFPSATAFYFIDDVSVERTGTGLPECQGTLHSASQHAVPCTETRRRQSLQ
jgi:hypothetical protein